MSFHKFYSPLLLWKHNAVQNTLLICSEVFLIYNHWMFFFFFFYDDDQGFWESELNSFHSCINQPDSSYYLEQELVHQKSSH